MKTDIINSHQVLPAVLPTFPRSWRL